MPYYHDRQELLGRGVYRLTSASNPEFPSGALWDAYNIVYERSSQEPEKMRGHTLLGDDVNDVVSGLFDYAEGTEIIAASEDGGIYKRTTGNWAAVTGGGAGTFSTTDGVRWSGTMFYGATTAANLLLLTNSASGNAPQKYTSSAGISALGGSPPAAGQYPTSFAGRLWMASGDTLFYSAADNAEDWATLGGSFQCDRGSGDITGLYNFMGNLIIFKKRKVLRLLPGTTLASTAIRQISSVLGTQSFWTIQESTGSFRAASLLFLSDEGIHEIVPTQATGGFYIRNTAENIKPILDRRSLAYQTTNWATFNASRGENWLQYTLNDAHPDEGVIGNMAGGGEQSAPRWTHHDMRNKTAGTMYRSSGELIQIIGDAGGKVYQMHSGDDRNGASYRGFITTASYAQGDRSRMKKYGRIYLDAETQGTYAITCYSTLGRAGLPTPGGNVNQPTGFGDSSGWGVGKWGAALWGGANLTGQWFRPSKVRRGTHIRLRFETSGADEWFRVNGVNIEFVDRRHILAA